MTNTIATRLRAPADLARSLEKLGVKPESLTSKEAAVAALELAAGGHAQAAELRAALSSFSRDDLKAVREALGGGGPVAAPEVATRSGVGGAGVPRFAVEARLPKAEGNTAEVAALLKKYEPHGPDKVGRPLERVLGVVSTIDTMIAAAGSSPAKIAEALVQHDARRTIFLLEGQMRLYRDQLGGSAEKGLVKVKELEDKLGAVSLYTGLAKTAAEKHAPQQVVDHLKAKEAAARADLEGLVSRDWTPEAADRGQVPALNKLVKNLCEETFGRYAEDKDYLCGAIRHELKKIEKEPYDWNDLQGGIHEFRRDLRWIPVYVESCGGLMQLDDTLNPLPSLRPLLQDPLATSKYVQLPAPDREPESVRLSKSAYVAVMKAVLDLGAIKDQGERVEFLTQAYVDSGASATAEKAHAAVTALLAGDQAVGDIHATSKKIHDELVNRGVLKALRDELEG